MSSLTKSDRVFFAIAMPFSVLAAVALVVVAVAF